MTEAVQTLEHLPWSKRPDSAGYWWLWSKASYGLCQVMETRRGFYFGGSVWDEHLTGYVEEEWPRGWQCSPVVLP